MSRLSFCNAVRPLGLTAAFVLVPVLSASVFAQSPQLVIDILTAPQRHWNTTVVVRGHVRGTEPNPPGTNRGTYVFRDSSDADITVVTNELPAVGREFTVTALVEQQTPDAVVPVLREVSRRAGVAPVPPPAAERPAAPRAPVAAAPAGAASPAPPAVAPAPIATTPPPAPIEAVRPADTFLGMTTPVLSALIFVVAVLSLGLIVAFRPRRVVAAPRTIDVEPRVIVQGPRVQPQLAGWTPPAAAQAPSPDLATRFVPPPVVAPAASAATVLFVDLGADLLVASGPDAGKRFPLTKPRITIGRSGGRQNEVELNDSSVSREHAKIVFTPTDQTFSLINESSINPVRVNGVASESTVLQDNSTIQLGATTLTFIRRPSGPTA